MHEIKQVPPEHMSAEDRRREVATLLAHGINRLRDNDVDVNKIRNRATVFGLGFSGNQRVHTDHVIN